MKYDLLVKGGLLVDPAQGIEEKRDIGISGSHVAEVAEDIGSMQAKKVIDARGKIVTPGLIDLHTHIFQGVGWWNVNVEETCLAKGVTTVLDAGSSGALNFNGFRRFIVEPSRSRIMACLNISSIGLSGLDSIGVGELDV